MQAPARPESIACGCLTPAERTPPASANGGSHAETDASANIDKDDNKEDPRVVMEEGGGEEEEAIKVLAPEQEAVQLADEARDIDQEIDEKAAADREAEQMLLQRILAQPECGLQLIAEHTANVRQQAAMKSFALLTKGFKGRQAGLQRRAVVAEERCAQLAVKLGITVEEEEEEEEEVGATTSGSAGEVEEENEESTMTSGGAGEEEEAHQYEQTESDLADSRVMVERQRVVAERRAKLPRFHASQMTRSMPLGEGGCGQTYIEYVFLSGKKFEVVFKSAMAEPMVSAQGQREGEATSEGGTSQILGRIHVSLIVGNAFEHCIMTAPPSLPSHRMPLPPHHLPCSCTPMAAVNSTPISTMTSTPSLSSAMRWTACCSARAATSWR